MGQILGDWMIAVVAILAIATGSASPSGSVFVPHSRVEAIEATIVQDIPDTLPHQYNPMTVLDYLGPIAITGKRFPAAGKYLFAIADSRHRLLALTHTGCCEQDTLLRYDGAGTLGLPERDLSAATTAQGFHIGSSSARVRRLLGTPTILHTKVAGKTIYAYLYRGKYACPVHDILFVFDGDGRVQTIRDYVGC
jgi:hypothetical protein